MYRSSWASGTESGAGHYSCSRRTTRKSTRKSEEASLSLPSPVRPSRCYYYYSTISQCCRDYAHRPVLILPWIHVFFIDKLYNNVRVRSRWIQAKLRDTVEEIGFLREGQYHITLTYVWIRSYILSFCKIFHYKVLLGLNFFFSKNLRHVLRKYRKNDFVEI